MNDAQLIERLSGTDAFEADTPLPDELWTRSIALREIERRTEMQTREDRVIVKPDGLPEPPKRGGGRWLLRALAGGVAVIIAVVVAAVLLGGGDGEPPGDVTNNPVRTTIPEAPVAPEGFGLEGAASLIGISGRVTGGIASPLPDVIHFDEDGTFRVESRGETIDNGTYQTEGDVISFISEPSVPMWHHDPLMGPLDMSASVREGFPCNDLGGDYRVVFEGAAQFTFQVVYDECRPRIAVANRLEMELLTG